ncbi:outer membrane beta-barrel protein [uncultured Lutibacter sp.]|uniref:outer membrane beta-barrel protein n=1 Tax=uncultured Lutibacter sp. TaxID=437739 RepID=UPI002638DCE9|nr:outer membrane beta-barrel protein [uncultured Lutibacter sp.]
MISSTVSKYKLPYIFILFCLFFQTTFSQSSVIKGIVLDESTLPLEFTSVALLKLQDSTMVTFTVTDEKGQFEISDSPQGEFLLQFYMSGFTPLYKKINFKNQLIDLKTITLKYSVEQLNEVTITAVVPVQIKKDTVAYNADSFKIHHDDNIEDLLKKLPGVELNSDGSIISQGNEITKIFVDGKEFFSGDPAIVLKNLSADAISKIQVIDKKSEQAELTGVEDDEKSYVINLTLKKGKKSNGFGKASAGIGLDEKYFSNLNYNKFSPKLQVSIIGKYNNINITGSNIKDFLSSNGGLADDSDDNEDPSSFEKNKKNLSGNLTTGVGGFHIGYEFKPKEVLNADYFYNYLDNTGTSFSKRTSFSRAKNFQSESDDENDKNTNNQHLNFNYENKSSKTSRFFIKGNYTSDKTDSELERKTSYFNEDKVLNTSNNINYLSNRKRDNGSVRMNYYQLLNTNKRNFTTGLSFSSLNSKNFRDQFNETTNHSNNRVTETKILKDELIKNNSVNFNFTFTEPLGNNHFLKLQTLATIKNGTEEAEQKRNKNGTEETPFNYVIDNKEERFSSNLIYSYSNSGLNLNFATGILNLYRDFGQVGEEEFNRHQAYFTPTMSLRYKPKRGHNYSMRFRRSIRSPQNYSSSPVINDLNPYYIRKGNPYLNTEKVDDLNFNISTHKFKSALSIYSKINFQRINDAIIPSLDISDDFIQTRSFVNEGKQEKASAEFNVNKRVKPLGIRYSFKTKGTYKTGKSIIDKALNDVKSNEYLVGFSLENNNKKAFDFKTGLEISSNTTNFSVVENLNRDYVKQHYFSKIDYDFSKKLNFNTQFDYYLYTDSNFESNQTIPFWNASVSYAVTKGNNGILKLILIDILDENVDIVRRSTINYFEETTNETLGRYFIISFTMRLNANGKKKVKRFKA